MTSYNDAKTNQMLVASVWNLPAGYKTGQYFKGSLDQTCASTTNTAVARWCAWMRWNMPGPLGTSPFPKAPLVAGHPVPLLIAQGSNDDIIHCIAPNGTPNATVPGPADCMSRALYDSLASAAYCPTGQVGAISSSTPSAKSTYKARAPTSRSPERSPRRG